MQAIVNHNYGSPDVLKCEEVEKPTPASNEVLLKVRAASINPIDCGFLKGKPYSIRIFAGLRKPKDARAGRDVAGVVEAVGSSVTQLKPGDEVFGACRGALAEYACALESKLAIKPENITFEQAASVPIAALTALQALRDKGEIRAGQQVLINGAAGGVGTFAVQLAKSFGAEITSVCSTRNVEMVRAIGADHVIDYTQEDFTKGASRYDLILDCHGHDSLTACRRVLKPKGIYVLIGARRSRWLLSLLAFMLKPLVMSPFVSQKLTVFIANINTDDLNVMGELMASGKVTPVIDRRYSLTETHEAMRYLAEGHARGKVVVTLPV